MNFQLLHLNAMMEMIKKKAKYLIFVLIIFIAFALLLEFVSRKLNISPLYSFEPGPYIADSKLGHKLKKNFVCKQGKILVTTNKFGYKDDFDKYYDENKKRILVLGDSFAFGFGVHQEDTFSERLEMMLEKRSGEPFEVFNTGVNGYATYQELKLAEEIIPKIKPNLVILEVCSNDYIYPEWQVQPDGQLISIKNANSNTDEQIKKDRGHIDFPFKKWLTLNSEFFRFIRYRYDILLHEIGMRRKHKVDLAQKLDKTWILPLKYIDEMVKISRDYGSEFMILLWPNTQPHLFNSFADSLNVSLVDLTPKWDVKKLTLKNDPHPNPTGHQYTAELLFNKIDSLNFFN